MNEFEAAKSLFARVVDAAPAERAELLAAAESEQPAVAREVRALLRYADRTTRFLSLAREEDAGRAAHLAERVAALGATGDLPTPALERLGPYRVDGLLGEGASAVVYRAIEEETGQVVALKVLRGGWSDPATLERFRREARVVAGMAHPGLVRVHRADLDEHGHPWIAMDLVEGRPLLSWASGRRLREVVELAAALCRVVEHAHRSGVVHRDLKPANILVDDEGRPRVLDFGVARLLHGDGAPGLTREGEILGTLAYMSPEQAAGSDDVGAATDVHALGVVLHETLTEQLPRDVDGLPLSEALWILRHDEPVEPEIPRAPGGADLAAVLRCCLEREPGRRYAHAGEVADELERVLAGAPTLARPLGPSSRLRRALVRERALVVPALLVLTILAVGASVARVRLGSALELEDAAARRRDELLRLADERRVALLVEESRHLWPRDEAGLAAGEDWLERVADLAARLPAYRARLAELEATGAASGGEDDRWEHRRTASLVDGLHALAHGDRGQGFAGAVRARMERARRRLTEMATVRRAAWDQVVAAVAGDPRFGGFRLTPRPGLKPLGTDPATGLQEFLLLDTGEVPVRGADGALRLGDDPAVILVLVPGGEVVMGAQAENPSAPRYDPWAGDHEGGETCHRAVLAPFLIARHELSQEQWRRLGAHDPEHPDALRGREAHDLPAAGPTFNQWRTLLSHHGLDLPTEAQWEHAARAGTDSIWWSGDTLETLAGCGNVLDRSYAETAPGYDPDDFVLDDGYPHLAPVVHGAPNAFGLHGVVGNVWELCLDTFRTRPDLPPRPHDGLRPHPPEDLRTARGGCYQSTPDWCRSAVRTDFSEDQASASLGVRPVAALVAPGPLPEAAP